VEYVKVYLLYAMVEITADPRTMIGNKLSKIGGKKGFSIRKSRGEVMTADHPSPLTDSARECPWEAILYLGGGGLISQGRLLGHFPLKLYRLSLVYKLLGEEGLLRPYSCDMQESVTV
jgi:hypothetical protein